MIVDILNEIKTTAGTNAKKQILVENSDNELFKKVLRYSLDPFTPFNVVKVPKVKSRLEFPLTEEAGWLEFFTVLDECASRIVTGNAAIDRIHTCFCSVKETDEAWMRKVLKKHLAIGASTKTVNKAYPGLIPTFEIALAQKFEIKRLDGEVEVAVEPKLDGIRCFSIVKGDDVKMFARSGKLITNFESTIIPELQKLPDGCYDGELMGQDFIALMRQAYRKDAVDLSGTYLALFDFLPLSEWESRTSKMTCQDRYEQLLDNLCESGADLCIVQPVERDYLEPNYDSIKELHDDYVSEGYEGAMIKLASKPYKFGRGPEVMKLKAFHDVDLRIEALLEGSGKHTGKLGAVKVIYNGVAVQVGSGFSDEVRAQMWEDKKAFVGRMIEVRYQEVTPDGSLRFPTFVCFRNDR
jgi:DNA ligase-1